MASSPSSFSVGDRVVLHDIRAKPDLNGRHGTIGVVLPTSTGSGAAGAATTTRSDYRFGIDLDIGGARLSLKPSNLTLVLQEEIAGRQQEQQQRASVNNGALAEYPHGRTSCYLLDTMRWFTATDYHGDDSMTSMADVDRLRRGGPRGLAKLNHLTAAGWTYWDNSEMTSDSLSTSLPHQVGVYQMMKDFLENVDLDAQAEEESKEMLQSCIAALNDVRAAAGWGSNRIHGDFWIVGEDAEGGSGTYVVSNANRNLVYKVLGIRNALFPMVLEGRTVETYRPILFTITMIPWYGRLIYDGVVSRASAYEYSSTTASRKLTQSLKDTVERAIRQGSVIEGLVELDFPNAAARLQERTAARGRSSSAEAEEGGGDNARTTEQQQPPPTSRESTLLKKLLRFPPMPGSMNAILDTNPSAYWVFRRMGYSEMDNPTHCGMIMRGSGGPIGTFQCSSLKPTSVDILKSIIQHAQSMGNRPLLLGIDDDECCARMRFLLKDHKDTIRVVYYRPPSEEETRAATAMHDAGMGPPV